ncbi:MAG: bifunctional demethylmenaquinone methyltransferase/2-methoxy-6-polyprenyl-1,4-benzoquinol methylase UbiE [candidate division Zixibacteria bacterium]|nr:bifunctional demethylmenaquinone methyltransferase/2-methoxy-6-polyprenyl-1,4-benzoquinol methylase UbiE [candidate division Zixibacteria bacterium]
MDKAESINLKMTNHDSAGGTPGNPQPPTAPSRHDVHKMFDRIASRYDLLNHLLSANIDKHWRQRVAQLLPDGDNLSVLDLACGTGDQLITLHETGRVGQGIGIDLAEKMLDVGRKKISRLKLNSSLSLQTGDAGKIPFGNDLYDTVTISFGIRNMTDVNQTLCEMYRVLKPGGRALILEFSLPANELLRNGYLFYLRHLLPKLGALISGDNAAYRYLNETIETFPHGSAFCALMTNAGFKAVSQTTLSTGIASIYQGDKK